MVICILAATVALVGALLAGFSARRSWPVELRKVLDAQDERVRAAEAIVEGLTAKWSTVRAEQAAWLEEAEDILTAVERRRARIAATESKARKAEDQQQLPADPIARRAAINALARQRGYHV